MPTRVIVTGDRGWPCYALAERVVERLLARHGAGLVVVGGDGPGVDLAFRAACEGLGVEFEPHSVAVGAFALAGGGPGHFDRQVGDRNREIVDAGADLALVFHRYLKGSKATADLARRCLDAGIPVWVVESEAGEPRRIWEV